MLRLRKIMDAKGVRLKACAELLGVSEKSLYNKLTGETDFSYKEVLKLRTIFPEYDIDYVLSEDTATSA